MSKLEKSIARVTPASHVCRRKRMLKLWKGGLLKQTHKYCRTLSLSLRAMHLDDPLRKFQNANKKSQNQPRERPEKDILTNPGVYEILCSQSKIIPLKSALGSIRH